MLISVGGFLVCSILIFFHGKKLSYYGDLIAIRSGIGKAWVGLILLASVTSLPELVISISSVTVIRSADLALGNILGSCVFNLAILSLLDAITRGQPLLSTVSKSNILAATFGTMMLSVVGVALSTSGEIHILGSIGIFSTILLLLYLVAVRTLYNYEREEKIAGVVPPEQQEEQSGKSSHLYFWYGMHAIMVVIAGLGLPYFADEIARSTSLGYTFVGTLLLAASSSLPEIAVSLSATRLGSADLAVGNLFGSNIFNIFILAVIAPFYSSGNLFQDASEVNVITVYSTIIMNAIAIIGLAIQPGRKKFYFFAWDTFLILLLYIATMLFLGAG